MRKNTNTKGDKKVINFITFDLGINGGTKDIIELANALHDRGHEVNIIYPKYVFPSVFNYSKDWITGIGINCMRLYRQAFGKNISDKINDWIKVRCNLLKVPFLTNKHIPDADFTFATWWETAHYIKKLNKRKGKKCYLIQHYETWGGRKSRVDKTYKMGFINIVHSSWLKDIIKSETGIEVDAVIPHAPDHKSFYFLNIKKTNSKDLRIMMIYRNNKWKGMLDGIKAFENAKKECKNLKLILVGEKDKNIPKYAEFYEKPKIAKINELYNTSDMFLFPSIIEGFGLPPMEAMCCKCPVVTTKVGAVPDYSQNGKSALISNPGDVENLTKDLIILAKNKRIRETLANNAYRNIQRFTWEDTAREIEKLLMKNEYR